MLNKVNRNRVEACLVPCRVVVSAKVSVSSSVYLKTLAAVKETLEVGQQDEENLLY